LKHDNKNIIKTQKNVTIKDIAKIAGVSHTCVSRALLDKEDIGKETKNIIRKLAEEMNYQPDDIARNLVSRSTRTIGVFINSFRNPRDGETIQALSEEIERRGYSLVIYTREKTPTDRAINLMLRKKVEGIVFFTMAFWDYKGNVPAVFCGNDAYDKVPDFVTIDRAKGVFCAVEYLMRLGHKDFAFLCHPNTRQSINRNTKFKGFRDALVKNGLPLRDEWIIDGVGFVEDGYDKTKKLLKNKMPTAIFYNGDSAAIGGMAALAEEGVKIPDDVSVVGFDNIAMSRYTIPSLTTIERPVSHMIAEAVKILFERMENPDSSMKHKILIPRLIIRNSTGPANFQKG